jgi:hypothetical protein
MKIRPVGAELSHADRRTDMTKLAVAFRNFVNALKNETSDSPIFRTYVVYLQHTLLLDIILSEIDKPKYVVWKEPSR